MAHGHGGTWARGGQEAAGQLSPRPSGSGSSGKVHLPSPGICFLVSVCPAQPWLPPAPPASDRLRFQGGDVISRLLRLRLPRTGLSRQLGQGQGWGLCAAQTGPPRSSTARQGAEQPQPGSSSEGRSPRAWDLPVGIRVCSMALLEYPFSPRW